MTTQESEQDKSKPHEIIKVDNFVSTRPAPPSYLSQIYPQ